MSEVNAIIVEGSERIAGHTLALVIGAVQTVVRQDFERWSECPIVYIEPKVRDWEKRERHRRKR